MVDADPAEILAERLLPVPGKLRLADVHRQLEVPADARSRAWIAVGMVASRDGAIAVDGTSGGLGGAADKAAFRRLRGRADGILVGAGTVRAENYGPARAPDDRDAAARARRGQQQRPRIIVVTRSGALDAESRLFEGGHRPIVVTTTTADLGAAEDLVDVVRHGDDAVDLRAAIETLRSQHGMHWLTAEGGPSLNADLLRLDLVDEIYLTQAPEIVGAHDRTLFDGDVGPPRSTRIVSLHAVGDELLFQLRPEPS